jgi:hypothetical protein
MIGFVCACGGATSPPDGNVSMGGVSLTIDSASVPVKVASVPPSANSGYVQLDVTLKNIASAAAVSTNPELFSLTTDRALVYTPVAVSSELPQPCSATTAIAIGGVVMCSVVFDVPNGETPTLATYDDKQGHTSSTSIPMIAAPDACDVVGSFNLSSSSCFSCLQTHCMAENMAAENACATTMCSSCTPSVGGDCMCLKACSTSSCWSAIEAADACFVTSCQAACR